ncbi:hypothetical protein O6H91_01G092800 [Diphasiastrum complanatum]|uniref:Uncharacterized protein n=1 Tax=Diphasiastrum complanatum TaxID=34168 RepID=A0ACC2ETS5_DIPCM|nr:hypothetical protein O6H91_01G092800 [Diphasiastrum complanatum]
MKNVMQPKNLLSRHGSTRRLQDETTKGHWRNIPEPPNSDSQLSTSALGFPFGTALILLIVCGVSMVFLCFYLWKRIRSHTSSSERPAAQVNFEVISEEESLENSIVLAQKYENLKPAVTSPVLMPGNGFPKYFAWPAVGAPLF